MNCPCSNGNFRWVHPKVANCLQTRSLRLYKLNPPARVLRQSAQADIVCVAAISIARYFCKNGMLPFPIRFVSRFVQQPIIALEYCKTSSKLTGMPLVMDHILPQVAGGSDEPENIAAACYRCNEFKGSKTHAPDPATSILVPLFNPHQQSWTELSEN